MTKISRLIITVFALLALLLLATKGVDAQSSHTQSPNSGTWSFTGSLHVARSNHTATLLSNRQILVAGGLDSFGNILTSAELYNPTTRVWSFTGSLKVARQNFRATPLANGEVLVEGGIDATGAALTSAELYNPATGTWSLTGSMNVGRENHQAVLLNNGMVLVAGGDTGTQDNPFIHALASAELYDPTAGTWSLTGSMHLQRFNQPMLVLPNGKVLVAGGDDGAGECCVSSNLPLSPCFCPHSSRLAELYNPTTGTWSSTGKMAVSRVFHSASLLTNSKVLVEGGEKCTNPFVDTCKPLSSAEIYDITMGEWSLTNSLHSTRFGHTSTRLGSTVVVSGGGLASTEVYNATTGVWSLSGNMNVARGNNTATRFMSGLILVTGGIGSSGVLNSSEIYTP